MYVPLRGDASTLRTRAELNSCDNYVRMWVTRRACLTVAAWRVVV